MPSRARIGRGQVIAGVRPVGTWVTAGDTGVTTRDGSGVGEHHAGEMPDQLVCIKCWKWWDGRTICPNCKVPLVDPESGLPVAAPGAPAGAAPPGAPTPGTPHAVAPSPGAPVPGPPFPGTPSPGPPAAWPGVGAGPAPSGVDFGETLPPVSGYPTGTPLETPTRVEVKHLLSDSPTAAPVPPGPLQARLLQPPPPGGGAPAPREPAPSLLRPETAGSAGEAVRSPGAPVGPLGPAFPRPTIGERLANGGDAGASRRALRASPGFPASSPPLRRTMTGGLPTTPAPSPTAGWSRRVTEVVAADAPGRGGPPPVAWQPGVPLSRAFDSLPPPALAPPAPSAPDAPPLRTPTPGDGSPVPPAGVAPPRPRPLSPVDAPIAPPPGWGMPPGPSAAAAGAGAPSAPPVPSAPPTPVSAPSPPALPADWPPPASAGGPAPAWPPAPSSGLPAAPATPHGPPPSPAPPPLPDSAVTAGPPPAVPSTVSGPSPPSLLVAAAIGLVVGLAVTVLWVAAALGTGLYLGEIAVVVGAAAGLVVRQWARASGPGPTVVATLVALVAIAPGMLFAALAVYSSANAVSFVNAVGLLDRSFLPQLWSEIGVLGAVLGAAGVVLAALVTLRWHRASSH